MKQRRSNGTAKSLLDLPDEILVEILERYTRKGDIGETRRCVAPVCRRLRAIVHACARLWRKIAFRHTDSLLNTRHVQEKAEALRTLLQTPKLADTIEEVTYYCSGSDYTLPPNTFWYGAENTWPVLPNATRLKVIVRLSDTAKGTEHCVLDTLSAWQRMADVLPTVQVIDLHRCQVSNNVLRAILEQWPIAGITMPGGGAFAYAARGQGHNKCDSMSLVQWGRRLRHVAGDDLDACDTQLLSARFKESLRSLRIRSAATLSNQAIGYVAWTDRLAKLCLASVAHSTPMFDARDAVDSLQMLYNLQVLHLTDYPQITAAALFDKVAWPHLREVSLISCALDDTALKALADKYGGQLRTLCVSQSLEKGVQWQRRGISKEAFEDMLRRMVVLKRLTTDVIAAKTFGTFALINDERSLRFCHCYL